MSSAAEATWSRHRLPFGLLGVPTHTIDTSASSIVSVVARSFPAVTPLRIRSVSPGSTTALTPWLMLSTFTWSTSMPRMSWPAAAKHAAETEPT